MLSYLERESGMIWFLGHYILYLPVWRIQDVYPGSWFLPIPDPGSWIPDLGSQIQKQQRKTGVKKFFCQTIFCSHKFHKTQEKNLAQFSKNYWSFYPKNCHQALNNMGLGSRKNLFRIPDPGVKKAPDPGSGSATLLSTVEYKTRISKFFDFGSKILTAYSPFFVHILRI